jgi:hypothetical protein
MLRQVALVRTDVSEELSTSFIRVTRIVELGATLAVTSKQLTLRRNTKSPNCRSLQEPRGVTSQKTPMFKWFLIIFLCFQIFVLNSISWYFLFCYFLQHNGIEIWARPITPVYQNYFSYAVAFLNRRTDGTPSDVAVTLRELGLLNPGGYSVDVRYFWSKCFWQSL